MRRSLVFSLAALSVVTAACATSPSAPGRQQTPSPTAPREFVLTATDFTFAGMPETISAGEVTFVFENDGEFAHELSIGTIPRDKTMEQVAREAGSGDAGGRRLGLIPAIAPGESAELKMNLQPGWYGYACFVGEGTSGEPHALHGMTGEFTVVAEE